MAEGLRDQVDEKAAQADEKAAQADGKAAQVAGVADADLGPDAAGETPKAGRRKLKRWQMTLGVVVIVVAVCGVGFGVWHNQPSFCGVCHTPMSNYVYGYENTSTQMAYQHGHLSGTAKDTLKSGVSDSATGCLGCHEATFDEQVSEATAWVSGNYTIDQNGDVVSADAPTGDKAFCTRCHDWSRVVEKTANYWGEDEAANPHASHQGELVCSTCHNPHGTSTLYCSSCHDFDVPEGWQTVAEAVAAES